MNDEIISLIIELSRYEIHMNIGLNSDNYDAVKKAIYNKMGIIMGPGDSFSLHGVKVVRSYFPENKQTEPMLPFIED